MCSILRRGPKMPSGSCAGERFYEADKLEWALNTFREAMQYISAAYYPASLVFYPMESNLGYRPGVSKELLACLDDEQVNIYRDICNQLVLPSVSQGTAGCGRHFDRHADAADRRPDVLQDDQGDVPERACRGRRQRGHAVAGRVAEARDGSSRKSSTRRSSMKGEHALLWLIEALNGQRDDGLGAESHVSRCRRRPAEQGHLYREDDGVAAAGLRRLPARSLLRAGADHSLSRDARLLLGPLHVLRPRPGLLRSVSRHDGAARRRSGEGAARQISVPAFPVFGRILSAGAVQEGRRSCWWIRTSASNGRR